MDFITQMFGSMQNFNSKFNMFKQQFGQQDPKMMVQQLLNSGRMSQSDFNRLRMMANMITGRNL